MSATPKGPRRQMDQYGTDPVLALAVCRTLVSMDYLFDGCRVLEPHVGTGPFVDALQCVAREYGWRLDITVADLDAHAPGLSMQGVRALPPGDSLTWMSKTSERFDLVVGNPPFGDVAPGKKRGPVVAHLHIEAALKVAPVAAFIVRTGLLTTSAERRFGIVHPPHHRFELWPRPSFMAGGTDSCEYLCGVWQHERPASSLSIMLDWRSVGAAQ